MKILITGVAGLIGSNLADWIVRNHPHEPVVGVDNMSGGFLENIPLGTVLYTTDLREDLEKIFSTHSPDIVYHFAAYAAEGLSPFIRCFNYSNNLVSTANVINMCIKYGVRRLVFTSSMAVYGTNTPPFDECMTPAPIDPYGIAKYACEMDLKVAHDQHGLDFCIVRPHNVYGPRQNIWDRYRNVLGIWMYQVLQKQPITVFGDGHQRRAFTYIDDILEPLYQTGVRQEASGQIFNLGSPLDYSILEAAKMLLEITGTNRIEFLDPRHEVKEAFTTWEKSASVLEFADRTGLSEGLTRMWEWAQKQPQRPRYTWEKYELDTKLYPYWSKGDLLGSST